MGADRVERTGEGFVGVRCAVRRGGDALQQADGGSLSSQRFFDALAFGHVLDVRDEVTASAAAPPRTMEADTLTHTMWPSAWK